MSARDLEQRRANARWAIGHRWGNLTPEQIEQRQEIKAQRLAEHIRHVVDSAPPLTQAQRDQLAVILRTRRTPQEAA